MLHQGARRSSAQGAGKPVPPFAGVGKPAPVGRVVPATGRVRAGVNTGGAGLGQLYATVAGLGRRSWLARAASSGGRPVVPALKVNVYSSLVLTGTSPLRWVLEQVAVRCDSGATAGMVPDHGQYRGICMYVPTWYASVGMDPVWVIPGRC